MHCLAAKRFEALNTLNVFLIYIIQLNVWKNYLFKLELEWSMKSWFSGFIQSVRGKFCPRFYTQAAFEFLSGLNFTLIVTNILTTNSNLTLLFHSFLLKSIIYLNGFQISFAFLLKLAYPQCLVIIFKSGTVWTQRFSSVNGLVHEF